MEHLNKQQVVLICILVALVTSVATAISVVSLTDEYGSPTQTIYRVIETTIDKVADIPKDEEDKEVPVKETPKPSAELSASDIAQSGARSLVRIYDITNGTKQFTALGVVVGGKDGVLTSTLQVTRGTSFVAILPGGVEVSAAFVKEIDGGFNYFTLSYPASVKNKVPALDLKSLSNVKLGGSVVAVGGKEEGDVVSTGIVSEIGSDEVTTDMKLSSIYSGFLLFDTSGNLVGIEKEVSGSDGTSTFINASTVKTALSGLL